MSKMYRLTYQPSPTMDLVQWEKTADELLVPNGNLPLIVWMFMEAEERNLPIKLEEITPR